MKLVLPLVLITIFRSFGPLLLMLRRHPVSLTGEPIINRGLNHQYSCWLPPEPCLGSLKKTPIKVHRVNYSNPTSWYQKCCWKKSGDHHLLSMKPYQKKRWDILHINWCSVSSSNSMDIAILMASGISSLSHFLLVILLMVQKSGVHQLRLVVYHITYRGFIHSRWLCGISEPSTVYNSWVPKIFADNGWLEDVRLSVWGVSAYIFRCNKPLLPSFQGRNLGAFKRPNQILISPGVNGYDLRGQVIQSHLQQLSWKAPLNTCNA